MTRTALPMATTDPELGRNIPYETFMDCVHCGLCLGSCPTFLETGNENDSPRGRIYLWRAVTDGRLELDAEVRRHLDLCLECLACETACPSGVQYGRIIGSYKKDLARLDKPAPELGWLARWMLYRVTPYSRRMRWALAPLRLLQKLRLGWLARGMAKLMPRTLREMQEIVPPRLQPHYGGLPEVLPPLGEKRAKVALLTGCAADAFYPQTTVATAIVLQHNGCEVLIPRSQGCCGALHYHGGDVPPAQGFAIANCQALADDLDSLDAIITNAGGCGPVLKEYDHILGATPHAEFGARFAEKVRDVHEFLWELGPAPPKHELRLRATYHDACGLCHAQQIRQAPRELLALIPGLELVPLNESEICCGAAGSYNIEQPDMAQDLGQRKAGNIAATQADVLLTANVGCLLQIARHLRRLGSRTEVMHPMDALVRSYERGQARVCRFQAAIRRRR